MDSLEFINKEIKFLEDMISMDMALIEDEYDLEEIAKKQQHLSHLHQIKTELEAWEICKKYSHINNYNSNDKRFDITIWLNTENCDFESCATYDECLKVKKALETSSVH